MPIVNL